MAKEAPVEVKSKKSDTQVLSHHCQNKWMDERYFPGGRVMNHAPGKAGWRCTNCGEIKK